jgi:hypothetical protein
MSTLYNGCNCTARIEAATELEIQETISLIPAVVLYMKIVEEYNALGFEIAPLCTWRLRSTGS